MKSKAEAIFTKPFLIIVFALICTLLWGSAFPCVKIGYELFEIQGADIPTKILFAGYRFVLAGIFVLVLFIVINKKLIIPTKKIASGILVLGLLQTTIQYIFFYIGLSNTTGVKGSILNATGTFISVILAHFCYRNDKLTVRKIMGCLIGFAGVVLINLNGTGMESGFKFLGEGSIILAQVSFAFGVIITKKLTQETDSVVVTGYQLTLGGAVLILVGFLTGGRLNFGNTSAVFMLLYLAILSAVAFTLWAQLLKYNPVGKIMVFNFLVPIFGTSLSVLLLKEDILYLQAIIAMLLVSTGIYIINKKKIKNS